MTLRTLQSLSDDVRRKATREYHQARVTLTKREIERETDEEIRWALRGVLTADVREHNLGSPAFD